MNPAIFVSKKVIEKMHAIVRKTDHEWVSTTEYTTYDQTKAGLKPEKQDVDPAPWEQDEHDPVNHPRHYTGHPSGVECIDITRHMGFNLGNAMKYVWRADLKNGIEDLRKAIWYIEDEIKKREKVSK